MERDAIIDLAKQSHIRRAERGKHKVEKKAR
jgi:hypothetical protein